MRIPILDLHYGWRLLLHLRLCLRLPWHHLRLLTLHCCHLLLLSRLVRAVPRNMAQLSARVASFLPDWRRWLPLLLLLLLQKLLRLLLVLSLTSIILLLLLLLLLLLRLLLLQPAAAIALGAAPSPTFLQVRVQIPTGAVLVTDPATVTALQVRLIAQLVLFAGLALLLLLLLLLRPLLLPELARRWRLILYRLCITAHLTVFRVDFFQLPMRQHGFHRPRAQITLEHMCPMLMNPVNQHWEH